MTMVLPDTEPRHVDDESDDESDDGESNSAGLFETSEVYFDQNIGLVGKGEVAARGVVNGATPIWALKVGQKLFYFIWTIERPNDGSGNRSRRITTAVCEVVRCDSEWRRRIKQENHL